MKKALKPVELFVALGLAATVTARANTSPIESEENPEAIRPIPQQIVQASEGGEGGEGGHNEEGYQDKISGVELVNALRQGGYVIFFRHAQTEKDYADQADVNLNVNDCSTQRTLSEAGWKDARLIGKSFQELEIPVGEVYSSQYCRAWQTADLAFGKYQKLAELNFAPAEEYTEAQVAQMRAGIMPLLTAVPAAGTNTIIVGHDDVFESATGIYPEPQGIAFILKPDGQGGFEIVANLAPDEWLMLQQ